MVADHSKSTTQRMRLLSQLLNHQIKTAKISIRLCDVLKKPPRLSKMKLILMKGQSLAPDHHPEEDLIQGPEEEGLDLVQALVEEEDHVPAHPQGIDTGTGVVHPALPQETEVLVVLEAGREGELDVQGLESDALDRESSHVAGLKKGRELILMKDQYQKKRKHQRKKQRHLRNLKVRRRKAERNQKRGVKKLDQKTKREQEKQKKKENEERKKNDREKKRSKEKKSVKEKKKRKKKGKKNARKSERKRKKEQGNEKGKGQKVSLSHHHQREALQKLIIKRKKSEKLGRKSTAALKVLRRKVTKKELIQIVIKVQRERKEVKDMAVQKQKIVKVLIMIGARRKGKNIRMNKKRMRSCQIVKGEVREKIAQADVQRKSPGAIRRSLSVQVTMTVIVTKLHDPIEHSTGVRVCTFPFP